MSTEERIGGVTLDYSLYPGEDYYCDGEVEQELLKIVKENPPSAYDAVIAERADWPTLYHLSSARGNIVDWIPFDGTEKVLEIGAGPGAVTGTLSARTAEVTCIDLSRTRSLINAWRSRDRDNITIHVGNFGDVEPTLPLRYYDYIFLIGVFEYAASYLDVEEPFTSELKRILPHLKPGGRLVIAIENRLGMKYFAGAREDHTSRFFDGITNYEDSPMAVRTFSKPALIRLLLGAGVPEDEIRFYYPYPDYKFSHTVFSDRRLPEGTELTDNIRNFDSGRMLLFDEKKAYDGMAADGLYPLFSNSFEVICGPELPVRYARFSDDRAPEYRIATLIRDDGVFKAARTDKAREHLMRMLEAGKKLKERYAGRLNICPGEKFSESIIRFNYIEGESLEAALDRTIRRGRPGEAAALLKEYLLRIGSGSEPAVSDEDMIFQNIIIDAEGEWHAIDYEWSVDRIIPADELLLRALTVYMASDEKRREFLESSGILRELGITEDGLARARQEEQLFQERISGGVVPLGVLRSMIGGEVVIPEMVIRDDPKLLAQAMAEEEAREALLKEPEPEEPEPDLTSVQVYYDRGHGFSEEDSVFLPETYGDEGRITVILEVPEDVKRLRVDPAICPCVVLLNEGKMNGRATQALLRPETAADKESGAYLFLNGDPWFMWDMEKLKRAAGVSGAVSEVELTWQMAGLPQTMADAMKEISGSRSGLKKLFGQR